MARAFARHDVRMRFDLSVVFNTGEYAGAQAHLVAQRVFVAVVNERTAVGQIRNASHCGLNLVQYVSGGVLF